MVSCFTKFLLTSYLSLQVYNVVATYSFFPDVEFEVNPRRLSDSICVIVKHDGSVGGRLLCWGENKHSLLGFVTTDINGIFSCTDGVARPPHSIYGSFVRPLERFLPLCAVGTEGECYVDEEYKGGSIPKDYYYAILGTNSSSGEPNHAKLTAGGAEFNCAVLVNNDVVCFGDNDSGVAIEIEIDHEPDVALEEVDLGNISGISQIACSGNSCCILTDTHQVKCWGENNMGQLGYGDTNNRGFNYQNTMGQNLPYVDLGDESFPIDLVSSWGSFCALFQNQRVKCWGSRNEVGYPRRENNHTGDEPFEMGNNLPFLDLRDANPTESDPHILVEAIQGGGSSYCVLYSEKSKVRCWGVNRELGIRYNPDDNAAVLSGFLRDATLNDLPGPFELMGGWPHCVHTEVPSTQVICWGKHYNDLYSQVEEPDQQSEGYFPPMAFPEAPGLGKLEQIITGLSFICWKYQGHILKCQGEESTGALGRIDPTYSSIGSDLSNLEYYFPGTNIQAKMPEECDIDFLAPWYDPSTWGDNLLPVALDFCPTNSTSNYDTVLPQCQCTEQNGPEYSKNCLPASVCVHGTCESGTCSGVTGSGMCSSCGTGYAGSDCNTPIMCDTEHGICEEGTCSGPRGTGTCTRCKPGWYGPICKSKSTCSEGGVCTSDACAGALDSSTGKCDECLPEYFGEDCASLVTCKSVCKVGTCSGLTGNGLCDECENGLQGENCETCPQVDDKCSFPGTVGCNNDGKCSCEEEFTGDKCDKAVADIEEAKSRLSSTLGGVVGVSVATVVVAVIAQRGFRMLKRKDNLDDDSSTLEKLSKSEVENPKFSGSDKV